MNKVENKKFLKKYNDYFFDYSEKDEPSFTGYILSRGSMRAVFDGIKFIPKSKRGYRFGDNATKQLTK